MVSFEEIIVPKAFLKTRPNPEKTQEVLNFVKRTGHLDEPLTIDKGSKVLKDGWLSSLYCGQNRENEQSSCCLCISKIDYFKKISIHLQ